MKKQTYTQKRALIDKAIRDKHLALPFKHSITFNTDTLFHHKSKGIIMVKAGTPVSISKSEGKFVRVEHNGFFLSIPISSQRIERVA